MLHSIALLAAALAVILSGCQTYTYEVDGRSEVESRMQTYREQGYSAREAYAMSLRDTADSRPVNAFGEREMIGGYRAGVGAQYSRP